MHEKCVKSISFLTRLWKWKHQFTKPPAFGSVFLIIFRDFFRAIIKRRKKMVSYDAEQIFWWSTEMGFWCSPFSLFCKGAVVSRRFCFVIPFTFSFRNVMFMAHAIISYELHKGHILCFLLWRILLPTSDSGLCFGWVLTTLLKFSPLKAHRSENWNQIQFVSSFKEDWRNTWYVLSLAVACFIIYWTTNKSKTGNSEFSCFWMCWWENV